MDNQPMLSTDQPLSLSSLQSEPLSYSTNPRANSPGQLVTATSFLDTSLQSGHSSSTITPQVTPDPGNTIPSGYDIGGITATPIVLTDSVSGSDTNDYYRFILSDTRNVNLALVGLSANVNVQLFNAAGTLLNSSVRTNITDEAINQTLQAGDYYLRVYPANGDSTYTLIVSATDAPPTTSPSNLLPIETNLGILSNLPINNTGFISSSNTADVYRFRLATSGSLNLTLTELQADVDIRLIQDINANGIIDVGEEITRSQQAGTRSESLQLDSLAAGNYLVQVYQYQGVTNYTLSLSSIAAGVSIPDLAGNTLTTALDIGVLSTQQTFNDFVGAADPNDYYQFTLDTTAIFDLDVTGLSSDADVQLLSSDGALIASSIAAGINPESITRTLTAGTYYIRVFPYNGDTDYTLAVAASPADLPEGYDPNYGYGLVNAAAAVAQALGQSSPFAEVTNLGGNSWDLDQIQAPEVWAQGYTGQGVVVAVVDSGVDITHTDLDANIWINSREIAGNGLDDDGNGYIDDINGWDFVDNDNLANDLDSHGTHVAGTIAAENNDIGATGVAYNARIMPVRVLDADGNGRYADVAAGIRYAADSGADIINLSLGGGSSNSQVVTAIDYAVQRGALVVIAAGNEGDSQPSFPANITSPGVLAVGAVNNNQKMASFSNLAGSAPVNYVVGPGVGIYSTTPNNNYASFNGTSMATPHIAGVAALLLSANPNLSPAQLVSLLTSTADSEGITV
ncbi:S8 family serine peptidase [Pantanalinema sp. GBBB05]|uniref:S8 family serine peptidase n=1 Tax=Pantanalinema sp. GBBB05 TaxID=2604139 RepID=UPI003D8171B2